MSRGNGTDAPHSRRAELRGETGRRDGGAAEAAAAAAGEASDGAQRWRANSRYRRGNPAGGSRRVIAGNRFESGRVEKLCARWSERSGLKGETALCAL